LLQSGTPCQNGEMFRDLASQKDQHDALGKEKPKEVSRPAEESKKLETREAMTEKQSQAMKPGSVDLKEKELDTLRKSLQEEKNRAEQYLNSLKYLKAEFENYQKRTAKEMDELVRRGSERLAGKLLGIVDDFERTIKASKAVADQSKLLAGVEMILKELLKTLRSEGIVKIDAVGKKFDPQLHESVAVSLTSNCPPGTVVEEVRPGYMFDGRVIRPSMVTVANVPEKKSSPKNDREEKREEGSKNSERTEEETDSEK
jgi:molecular chaperone GrpE